MHATVKVTEIGKPPANSKVEVIGVVEETGMNAGGGKKYRVRDERGRVHEMESRNLTLDVR